MQRAIRFSIDMAGGATLPKRGVATRPPKLRRLLSAMVEKDRGKGEEKEGGIGGGRLLEFAHGSEALLPRMARDRNKSCRDRD